MFGCLLDIDVEICILDKTNMHCGIDCVNVFGDPLLQFEMGFSVFTLGLYILAMLSHSSNGVFFNARGIYTFG